MKATRLSGLVAGVIASVVGATGIQAGVSGQWDFESGNLAPTIGAALEYRGATEAGTAFGTTTSFGIPDIGGQPAAVMQFPATDSTQGFTMTHGAAPNGGGAKVNQYSVVYDLYFPPASYGEYRSLLQTDPANSSDGDFFVRGDGGLGISGNYQGNLDDGNWHRVAAVFDLTSSTLSKYIDGALVGSQTLSAGVDGRWSLLPTALLFADEDGETQLGYVNSIQFNDTALSAAEVALLGGPTAGGIAIPEPGTFSLMAVALAVTAARSLRKRR